MEDFTAQLTKIFLVVLVCCISFLLGALTFRVGLWIVGA